MAHSLGLSLNRDKLGADLSDGMIYMIFACQDHDGLA